MAKKTLYRTRGDRWCRLDVDLTNGRLSICGAEGRIVGVVAARVEALEYWRLYFEDDPDAIREMNARFGRRFTSAMGAARYVTTCDGDLHGLDVERESSAAGGTVWLTESCGQIVEALREWFPECGPYLKWHLNDMKAGCEHQEALGWGHGRDVALVAADLTYAQRKTLAADEKARVKRAREGLRAKRIEQFQGSASERVKFLKTHCGEPTVSADEFLRCGMQSHRPLAEFERGLNAKLDEEIAAEVRPVPFRSAIFADSLGAPCPTCGYKYGTAWLRRELPSEVLAWFEALPEGDVPAGVSLAGVR